MGGVVSGGAKPTRDQAALGWATIARRLGLSLASIATCAAALASTAGALTVTDLGTLPGGFDSSATAINASGQVAGSAETAEGHGHAFFWTRAGGMVDLGTLGGDRSYATGLSSSGQVVGDSETSDGRIQAFSWTQAGGMVDLGTLGGCSYGICSAATGVNASGEVVGYAETAAGHFDAFLWTLAGGMVDIGTLGGDGSDAYAVNDSGEIVGSSQTSAEEVHAFSWTPEGGMVDLGTLAGRHFSKATLVNDRGDIAGKTGGEGLGEGLFWTPETGSPVDIGTLDETAFSEPLGMGSTGQVVGASWVQEVDTRRRAFSWSAEGGMIDFGTLPGGNESEAEAVNGAGEVVGFSLIRECPPCSGQAFSWTAQGGMVDLGAIGGIGSRAWAINESGAIAGSAADAEGDAHAVVWNLAPPVVDRVTPANGPTKGGTTVKITGTELAQATGVRFGATNAATFDVISETEIEAISPPGAGTVDVTVRLPEGVSETSATDRFTYIPAPSVERVARRSGPASGGRTVTIKGSDLTGATEVDFGSTPASSFTVNRSGSITAVSPPSTARTVDVTVTTPGGRSAASSRDHYRFGPPTVTAVSPDAGLEAGDTEVTVHGSGFGLGTEATAFKFGSTAATTVDCTSTTTCTVVVPSHPAGAVNVKAAVGGQRSPTNAPRDQYIYESA